MLARQNPTPRKPIQTMQIRTMIKCGIAALFSTNLISARASDISPKIHKLCIEAKDYAGCVRSMKGDTSVRVINSQGADVAEGNKCPAGSAYVGGGNCQQVKCEWNSSGFNALGHYQLIAGKKDRNGKDIWGCKYNFWYGAGVLRLSGAVMRTTNTSDCPAGEPKLGFNNTCQTADRDWLKPSEASQNAKQKGPACDFKLKMYDCSYDAYLDANPAIKQWAELNPEMAAKERARLQSID